MQEVLPREYFESLRPYINLALAGERTEFEITRRHPRAGNRSLIGRVIPDLQPDGTVNGFLEVFRDVTEGRKRELEDHAKRVETNRLNRAIAASEKRFRTIMDQSPLSMQIFNPAGRCVYANVAWQHLWQARLEDLETYNILNDPQFAKSGLNGLIARAFEGEVIEIAAFEYDPRESGFGGRPRWVAALFYPIQTEEEAHEVVLVLEDVSEELAAERELQSTKERLQLIVSTSQDAVITIDSDDKVTGWDGQAANIFGWTRAEALGQKLYPTVIPEEQRKEGVVGFAHFLMEDEVRLPNARFETEAINKEGRRFPVEVAISSAKQSGTTFYSVFIRDITERIRAEEELKELNTRLFELNAQLEQRVDERTAELRSANRELESFGYAIAHDLRNPLRRLTAIASIIEKEGKADEETRENLDQIKEFAKEMTKLIEDHLHFAKFAQTELKIEPVQFSSLAWSVARDVQKAYPGLEMRVRAMPNLVVQADPGLLRVLLENLVENAAKFTQGNAAPKVEIGTMSKGGKRIFYVSDNGIGFDQEFEHKLFQPFERLHREEQYGGTGIGLFNAKRIVERHGGKIWAKSEEGKGATFYFTVG